MARYKFTVNYVRYVVAYNNAIFIIMKIFHTLKYSILFEQFTVATFNWQKVFWSYW